MSRSLIFCLAMLSTAAVHAAELSGSVDKIHDGDTFSVCDKVACHKIRICGINAPEKGELGYDESSVALASIVRGRAVRCVQVGGGTPCDGRSKATNRDRIVAQCFADGADIGASLVEQGLACDWLKFSGGHYSKSERGKSCELALQTDAPSVETNLEAQTLARMKEYESSVRSMKLDPATTDRLVQQGLEQLLKSYRVQSPRP